MKYIKYLLLWILSGASAFGAYYAPVNPGCDISRCSSMPEAFFAVSAWAFFCIAVFLIIDDKNSY